MAATDVERAGLALPRPGSLPRLPAPWLLVCAAGRALRRGLRLLGALLPDILAVEFLLATVGYVFRDAILDGLVFHEADTSTMFYPVFAALGAALGRGELLLWTPHLFTGFPLLAEGQTGVLYPPNWLAATLLPTPAGFIWLRIAHLALAATFTYLFGRSLRLSSWPAAASSRGSPSGWSSRPPASSRMGPRPARWFPASGPGAGGRLARRPSPAAAFRASGGP